jgi:hypothetical protein
VRTVTQIILVPLASDTQGRYQEVVAQTLYFGVGMGKNGSEIKFLVVRMEIVEWETRTCEEVRWGLPRPLTSKHEDMKSFFISAPPLGTKFDRDNDERYLQINH